MKFTVNIYKLASALFDARRMITDENGSKYWVIDWAEVIKVLEKFGYNDELPF